MESGIKRACKAYAIQNTVESAEAYDQCSLYVFDAIESRIDVLKKHFIASNDNGSILLTRRSVSKTRAINCLITEILHFILKILDILIEMNIRTKKGSLLLNENLYDKKDYPEVLEELFKVMGETFVTGLNNLEKENK